MARAKYSSPIDEITGSIGSTTFQRNYSGDVIRLKPCRNSNRIKNPINFFLSLSQRTYEWRLLSPITQGLWNTFAASYTKTNYYNEIKNLTGFNWYCSINNNLQNLGYPIISSPPSHTLPLSLPTFTLSVNDLGIIISTDPSYSLGNNTLIAFTTPPITSNFTKQRSKLRYTTVNVGPTFSTWNLKSDWEAIHNKTWPSVGSLYNISISIMLFHIERTSGINSIASFYFDGTNTNILGGIGNMVINNNFVIS